MCDGPPWPVGQADRTRAELHAQHRARNLREESSVPYGARAACASKLDAHKPYLAKRVAQA